MIINTSFKFKFTTNGLLYLLYFADENQQRMMRHDELDTGIHHSDNNNNSLTLDVTTLIITIIA